MGSGDAYPHQVGSGQWFLEFTEAVSWANEPWILALVTSLLCDAVWLGVQWHGGSATPLGSVWLWAKGVPEGCSRTLAVRAFPPRARCHPNAESRPSGYVSTKKWPQVWTGSRAWWRGQVSSGYENSEMRPFSVGWIVSPDCLPGTVPGTVVWKENSPLILGFIEILSLIEILWPRNEVFPVTLIILCEIVKITYPGFSVIQGMVSFFIKARLGTCPQCRWVIIAAVPVVALVSGEPVATERTVFHPPEQLDWMEHSTE